MYFVYIIRLATGEIYKCVDTRLEARVLEKYFKSGFGREIIKEILEEKGV